MRILAFAGSLRMQSLNRRLIGLAADIARDAGAWVDLAEFREFDMPIYDGDLERSSGLPPGAVQLKRRLELADAVLIAAPEYNYSIAGPLKNAIDWVSRVRPMPWRGKSIYLMSASPSAAGGIRGLWQTRIPLEGCGALVFPDMFALANADEAFDEKGCLRDQELALRLRKEVVGFVCLAQKLIPIWAKAPPNVAEDQRLAIVAALEDQTDLQTAGQA